MFHVVNGYGDLPKFPDWGEITSEEVMAKSNFMYNFLYVTIIATFILLLFNWLVYGKISIWIKELAPIDEEKDTK